MTGWGKRCRRTIEPSWHSGPRSPSWHRVLIRRSERTSLNWTRMNRLIDETCRYVDFDAGLPRSDAGTQAFQCCIVEWLNRNPARDHNHGHARKRRPSRHSAHWGLEQRKVKASPRGARNFEINPMDHSRATRYGLCRRGTYALLATLENP